MKERYGTRIVASPGGRSVGGCKSILDGGYSGPSSHISLDMNLCLRSTCLPAGRLLFPSLLLPRLLRPSSCRLPLRSFLLSTRSCAAPPRNSAPSFVLPRLALSLSLSPSLLAAISTPPLHRGHARLFSFFGIPSPPPPSSSSARIHSSGVSLLAIREYTECLHRYSNASSSSSLRLSVPLR